MDRDLHIEPTQPLPAAAPVLPVHHESAPLRNRGEPKAAPEGQGVAASTGGGIRAAYAQFVINPDTHDVVVRIRDSATDQVLNEYPSKEVQAMTSYLQNYAETLARHRAALRSNTGV